MKPEDTSKDTTGFVEAFSLTFRTFYTESNPHRFGLPTDNPHQHRRKEEEAPHLHTGDNKSKA
jgi:hypothetical protein